MRLSATARTELRRRLREHPQIEKHLTSKSEVNRLPKEELLLLASKLGVRVDHGIVRPANYQDTTFNDPYAFTGALELDLTLGLLGRSIPHKVRLVYGADPEWEFLDAETGQLVTRTERATMHFEVMLAEDKDWFDDAYGTRYRRRPKPVWEQIDLFQLLPREVELALDELIDEDCKRQDEGRRSGSRRSEERGA